MQKLSRPSWAKEAPTAAFSLLTWFGCVLYFIEIVLVIAWLRATGLTRNLCFVLRYVVLQAYKTTEALSRRIQITVGNIVRGLMKSEANRVA